MINIVAFKQEHIEVAMQIAKENYANEQKIVRILPEIGTLPDLGYFAENGLGVAAIEDNQLIGFLCSYQPREDAFGTTNVRGGYVPAYAHGVAGNRSKDSRGRIYSLLYQAAADLWVKDGIRSHAITLYAHDLEGERSFFYNGFGLRCLDMIRSLDQIPEKRMLSLDSGDDVNYVELFRDEWVLLLEQHNRLICHLGNSPSFLSYEPLDEEGLYNQTTEDVRFFAAKVNGKLVAYIKLSEQGEHFATEVDDMINIYGAYCEEQYRGSGIYHNLLCHIMKELKKEGYRLLGVDCESFNPTALAFWTKYFEEYTHSLVRRIDEKAVDKALSNVNAC